MTDVGVVGGDVHQGARSGCRVATPLVRLEDGIAELDRIGRVRGIVPRRAVVAAVADHLFAEDDGVLAPSSILQVLLHLP